MRIFVTGGTGVIGSRLVPRLLERKDEVVALTRRPAEARELLGSDCTLLEGNPMREGPWMEAVKDCDAVLNLAGESIFSRRWNQEFKTLLRDSRIKTTENVVKALAANPRTANGTPKVLVQASAIGFYGPRGDEELTEDAPLGTDFQAHLCADWEKAARAVEQVGVRLAMMRIGVVLDKKGGALTQMRRPFELGIGGPIGSGKQWVAWIHHQDMVGLLLMALDNSQARGPINGTAPHPVTNKAFAQAFGRALHRPSVFPIPAFALRLKFGEVAEVLTTGQRVLPARALGLGYRFQFPDIDSALQNVVSH